MPTCLLDDSAMDAEETDAEVLTGVGRFELLPYDGRGFIASKQFEQLAKIDDPLWNFGGALLSDAEDGPFEEGPLLLQALLDSVPPVTPLPRLPPCPRRIRGPDRQLT